MNNEIKNGKEILDEFFNSIDQLPGVDIKIASTLKELYQNDKLSPVNLSNALFKQREDAQNDKN